MSHDDNDDDLNKLLGPLRNSLLTDLQMQRWQSAVRKETASRNDLIATTRSRWVLQLVVAMFVGIILGALVMKSFSPHNGHENPLVAQIYTDSATFEHSYTNLD